MPASSYIQRLRARVGGDLLLLPSVVGVIRDAGHRVLLVHYRSVDRWGLPGGGIEPGESPGQAIVREVVEETGLIVEPTRVVGVYGGESCRLAYPNGDRVEYVITAFTCRVKGGELRADGDEIRAVAYVVEGDIASRNRPAWLDTVLGHASARTDAAWFAEMAPSDTPEGSRGGP